MAGNIRFIPESVVIYFECSEVFDLLRLIYPQTAQS